MSGSPIIQNGKLVGAVTHVLVNDTTTGYGIFIENMLNAAHVILLCGTKPGYAESGVKQRQYLSDNHPELVE